jgi:murein DD-endopeptidase MepM/ murein hydrolase activator NlpD
MKKLQQYKIPMALIAVMLITLPLITSLKIDRDSEETFYLLSLESIVDYEYFQVTDYSPFFSDEVYRQTPGGITYMARSGQNVNSPMQGIVRETGNNEIYGKYLITDHKVRGQVVSFLYAWLDTIDTSKGKVLYKNTRIGSVSDNCGSGNGSLYVEAWLNDRPVSPEMIFDIHK